MLAANSLTGHPCPMLTLFSPFRAASFPSAGKLPALNYSQFQNCGGPTSKYVTNHGEMLFHPGAFLSLVDVLSMQL